MMAAAGIAYRCRMNDQVDSLAARGGRAVRGWVAARPLARGLCWALWLGLAAGAQAKTCEEVKDDIALSMDAAGLNGYSLQIVAGSTPLAGAKVVGRCEGGARKIVYRRFALPPSKTAVADAPPPEPAPRVAAPEPAPAPGPAPGPAPTPEIGRASCRERVS
jgi:hypothetical protein